MLPIVDRTLVLFHSKHFALVQLNRSKPELELTKDQCFYPLANFIHLNSIFAEVELPNLNTSVVKRVRILVGMDLNEEPK